MGRKAYEPTEEIKEQAIRMAELGIPQQQIALIIGISETTLQKYYGEDLKLGTAKGNVQVAEWAFDSARRGNIPMRIFLAKVRLGWKETGEDKSDKDKSEPNNITLNFGKMPE